MINDAIDADGKNVSHKDFWTPHIGKLQKFREELGGKNFQTFLPSKKKVHMEGHCPNLISLPSKVGTKIEGNFFGL